MRRLRFLIPCLALSLTACNEEVLTDGRADGPYETGTVCFNLSADMRNDVVSKASSVEDISLDDFSIEIYTSANKRIYWETYADTRDTVLHVNSGEYRLIASYGNANAVGFDAAYYKAEETFIVGPQEAVDVTATAKLANVKVAVNFDEDLDDKLSFDTYYALVRKVVNGSPVRKLRFNPDETRAGYIPSGNLEFVLYVQMAGVWKQYILPAEAYEPNDFVTFNVSLGRGEGDIAISIRIDDSVEVKEEVVEIPAEDVLPVAEPSITSYGFDADNAIQFKENNAEYLNEVWLSAYAEGELESVTLTVNDMSSGNVTSVELVSADAATVSSMEAAGIWWAVNDDNTSMAVSLTDAFNNFYSKTSYVGYDSASGKCLPSVTVTLDVTARTGKSRNVSDSFCFIPLPEAVASISWNDYDVWAWKIVNPVQTISKGNPSLFTLQGSADGLQWVTVGAPSVSGDKVSYGEIDGLAAGTTYYMRALYDGWYVASDIYEFKTEDAVQIADAGFENWTTEIHGFSYDFLLTHKAHNIDWYYPQTGWGVNSKKTMPTTTAVASANWNWIRFPMVAYTSDAYSGSKAAMIFSVSVGDGSSSVAQGSTNIVGEMWTGAADGSGNHSSDAGLALASRPSRFTFAYKYLSVEGETYAVYAELRAADGTVLATASTDAGAAASAWAVASLDFNYQVYDKKASEIYIQFRSSKNTTPKIDLGSSVTIAQNSVCEGNFGSVLHVDEIEMTY